MIELKSELEKLKKDIANDEMRLWRFTKEHDVDFNWEKAFLQGMHVGVTKALKILVDIEEK